MSSIFYAAYFTAWKSVNFSTLFFTKFYTDYPIKVIFSEIISKMIVIMFTRNELSSNKITYAIRFLLIYEGESGRGKTLK